MTPLNKNISTPRNSLRSRSVGFPLLATVLLAFCGAMAASAQDPAGTTGPEAYRPVKTVDDYMNPDKSADGEFDYATNTLRVEVWTDKSVDDVYRKGERLQVGFETNRDAYAVVYRIDAEGLVTVLWPRSRMDDGFVFGGHDYQLPVTGAAELHVATREGQGLVEAVVSQYPFDLRSLEIDFHHERAQERYDFRVAGDPFLAMNEVNFAVTGLEDSGEYVVTNYASYYVHQTVDHPRYLCGQCHDEEQVSYDPYRDECTLTIKYDYSWYNGWYDNYGYYPVYGNPVYVYIDPWTWSPWVNYWYRPYYSCAPWYGWGWGWGASYNWSYSPYYWGDCVTRYSDGHRRYRPLDRTRLQPLDQVAKSREYQRGSSMVRERGVTDQTRDAMTARTRTDRSRGTETVSGARGTSARRDYQGAAPATRTRTSFDQAAVGSARGGLRIRENVRVPGGSVRSGAETRRHTSAGGGRAPGLVPVTRDEDSWRGTTRVGGRSGSAPGSSTIGNSRVPDRGTSGDQTGVRNSRSRTGGDSKTVQPRQRSTRVWNSSGSRSGSAGESTRSRSGSSSSSSRGTGVDNSRGSTRSQSSDSPPPRSSRSSGSSVKDNSSSRSSDSGGSRSSGSSSGSSRSGSSRSGGSRSDTKRR